MLTREQFETTYGPASDAAFSLFSEMQTASAALAEQVVVLTEQVVVLTEQVVVQTEQVVVLA